VVPADKIIGPMIGPFAERAAKRMFERCLEDELCGKAFPELEENFETLMRELDDAVRTVELRHPLSNEPTQVELSRARVAQVIRFASYQPQVLSIMPLMIHRAAVKDDWSPLAAQWLVLGESMQGTLSVGLHYSIICSEDIPFIQEESDIGAEDGGHFLGSDPVEMLKAVCSEWPAAEIPEDFNQPLESDRPVLLLSGELDPVTPPEWGEHAAKRLSNSRHLTLKGKGHNVVHQGCVPFLLRDFLSGKKLDELDAECLERMRPTPFFLDFAGPGA